MHGIFTYIYIWLIFYGFHVGKYTSSIECLGYIIQATPRWYRERKFSEFIANSKELTGGGEDMTW